MNKGDTRIDLPGAAPPRWTRGYLTMLAISLLGASLGGGWAAHIFARGGGHAALALGLAAPFWLFTLAFVGGRASLAGRAAWSLARRAGSSEALERWDNHASMIALLMGLIAAFAGIAVSAADGPGVAQASVPMLAALGALLIVFAIVGRIAIVRAALALVRNLPTTTLAELEANEGNVELVLRIPDGAQVLELPFVRGRWAGVQLGVDFGARNQSWPPRLTVRDDTGSGDLDLGGFELCGWRSANAVETWTNEPPPRVALMREATGTSLVRDGATNVQWTVWALAPGDTLYVVGDATEVRRGFGAYRGGESTTVGSQRGIPAVAYIGDETELVRQLERELCAQPLVALLAVATLVALVWATLSLLA